MDAVQVELEDLVLGEALLERHRQDRLLHLAAEGAVVGEKDIAGELLGDGRSALYPAAAVDADLERASDADRRSEEHTSELQSLMRNSYAVFCLNKKRTSYNQP